MEKIPSGYVLSGRDHEQHSIWSKPPMYWKVYSWILWRAYHTPKDNLERGEFKTSLDEIREAMTYKAGYRTEKPTKKAIFDIVKFLRSSHEGNNEGNNGRNNGRNLISTTKVTHGMIIKVLEYSLTQNPKSYESNKKNYTDVTTDVTTEVTTEV